MNRITRPLLLPLIVGGCASVHASGPHATGTAPAHTRAALTHAIDSMVNVPEFRTTNWGLLIVDPLANDTLYALNATKLFIPASNQKLVSSSVMLEQLGPDYRFRTVVAARGPVAEQTISGDLAVIGRGDPTASDHMKRDAMIPLREIADSLWQRGIRHITGNVVAVGNAFPGPVAGFGWPWDGLDGASFAGVDELLFNEGLITIRVRPGARAGDAATVETKPARTFPVVKNEVTTITPSQAGANTGGRGGGRGGRGGGSGTRVSAYHDTLTSTLVVRGQVALGDSASVTITQHDPDAAYVAALTEALRDRGITVGGQAGTPDSEHADSMFTMVSVPLREILPAILKPSQNQIAEVFLRTIGLERTGIGTADSGRRVVERQFTDWKIPSDGYVVRDGSGLSRSDLPRR